MPFGGRSQCLTQYVNGIPVWLLPDQPSEVSEEDFYGTFPNNRHGRLMLEVLSHIDLPLDRIEVHRRHLLFVFRHDTRVASMVLRLGEPDEVMPSVWDRLDEDSFPGGESGT